jgi:6-phosphofructokinase
LNGAEGLVNNQFLEITESDYASYRNLGGYDFLGNGVDTRLSSVKE